MKKIFFVVLCSTPLCLLPMEALFQLYMAEATAAADQIKKNSTLSAGNDKKTQDVQKLQSEQNQTLKSNPMDKHKNNDAKKDELFKQLQMAGMADNPEHMRQVLESMQAKAKL